MLTFRLRWLGTVGALGAWLAFAGCDSKPTNAPATAPAPGHSEDDGHDHGEEGHGGEEHEAHDHAHAGPHGGDIIELGDEAYHAELVHENNVVTVYLLDGQLKNAVPIEAKSLVLNLQVDGAPKQFKLAAAPQDDDPEGKCSRFELTDRALVDLLTDEEELTGRLNVTIEGTQYVGDIHHHGHEEGHDHGDQEHEAGHDHADDDGLDHESEGSGDHGAGE